MHTTTLCKVGGSVMLEVPAAMLSSLQLEPGSRWMWLWRADG
jgi:antitoxin component of MazEF toxin-antitoxin module